TQVRTVPIKKIERIQVDKGADYLDEVDEEEGTHYESKKVPEIIIDKEYGFLDFKMGPKFGVFFYTDETVKEKHKNAFQLGFNATLWMKEPGIQFEVENCQTSFDGTIEYTDWVGTETYSYQEKLSVTPLWISFLMRKNAPNYFFVGAGMGMVMCNITKKIEDYEFAVKNDFFGNQFLIGVYNEKIGVVAKYTRVFTNKNWGRIELGGFSIAINIHL
ncbi:MAG: hypothetical protein JW871_08405, partial [Endomicrobiales bacterium]|nr:hypothetical protein [Endomicrobiales bacterium]